MKADVPEFVEKYELAVAFAREFVAEVGEERTHPVLARAFAQVQTQAGQDLAAELGSNSCAALAENLRRRAQELPSMEVLEADDQHVALKITKCRAWEALQYLGMPEICRLYCDSDDTYIKAFNPKMKLIRTQTLAAGDACCDHIWAMEDYEPGD